MRVRKIAILIDGGFFLKRIGDWPDYYSTDPNAVVSTISNLCRKHVEDLCHIRGLGSGDNRWLDHVYRLFYYDAEPYEGAPHHPFLNKQIEFNKSAEAKFRRTLFDLIRKERKFALRLGNLKSDGGWILPEQRSKYLHRIWHHAQDILAALEDNSAEASDVSVDAKAALRHWVNHEAPNIRFGIRQKGVDMKIGLDIASMAYKKHVDTIVLVTGDSDFVPAAKVARREGVEFLLDPLWMSVDKDLVEHIDGLITSLPKPIKSDR